MNWKWNVDQVQGWAGNPEIFYPYYSIVLLYIVLGLGKLNWFFLTLESKKNAPGVVSVQFTSKEYKCLMAKVNVNFFIFVCLVTTGQDNKQNKTYLNKSIFLNYLYYTNFSSHLKTYRNVLCRCVFRFCERLIFFSKDHAQIGPKTNETWLLPHALWSHSTSKCQAFSLMFIVCLGNSILLSKSHILNK